MVRDAWPHSGHIGQSPDPLQCNYISQLRAALASSSSDAVNINCATDHFILWGSLLIGQQQQFYNFFWTCYTFHYVILCSNPLQCSGHATPHPSPLAHHRSLSLLLYPQSVITLENKPYLFL